MFFFRTIHENEKVRPQRGKPLNTQWVRSNLNLRPPPWRRQSPLINLKRLDRAEPPISRGRAESERPKWSLEETLHDEERKEREDNPLVRFFILNQSLLNANWRSQHAYQALKSIGSPEHIPEQVSRPRRHVLKTKKTEKSSSVTISEKKDIKVNLNPLEFGKRVKWNFVDFEDARVLASVDVWIWFKKTKAANVDTKPIFEITSKITT